MRARLRQAARRTRVPRTARPGRQGSTVRGGGISRRRPGAAHVGQRRLRPGVHRFLSPPPRLAPAAAAALRQRWRNDRPRHALRGLAAGVAQASLAPRADAFLPYSAQAPTYSCQCADFLNIVHPPSPIVLTLQGPSPRQPPDRRADPVAVVVPDGLGRVRLGVPVALKVVRSDAVALECVVERLDAAVLLGGADLDAGRGRP